MVVPFVWFWCGGLLGNEVGQPPPRTTMTGPVFPLPRWWWNGLDPDALERLDGLSHGLEVLLAGLLLALRLFERLGELVEAGEGTAEVTPDDFDLRQGGFERGCWGGRRGFVGCCGHGWGFG